jgi:hypothetical protein
MDIVNKLTMAAAKDPRGEWAQLAFETIAHIESLRKEIRTQRYEIAGLREERNVLLEWDRPKMDNLEDFK